MALNTTLETLLADTSAVCQILQYHLLGMVVESSSITTTAMAVPTLLAGANVTVQLVK